METSLTPFIPLADRIWTAIAEPETVTVGLIAGETGALVVDTGSTPAQGAAIREAAERTAGVPVVAVAVTHWHFDHFFGLAGFGGLPGYAHKSVAAWLERPECADAAASLGLDVGGLARPTHTFALARTVDLGGRRAELVHFGPAHTDGDIVVIVPDAHVIFAGDMLERPHPSFEPESSLGGWPEALDGVLGATNEETILVPGHGAPMDRMVAFEQRGRIAALESQAEYLAFRGIDAAHALAEGEWPFPAEAIEPLLGRLYDGLTVRSAPTASRNR